jgi:hypothetical protein
MPLQEPEKGLKEKHFSIKMFFTSYLTRLPNWS